MKKLIITGHSGFLGTYLTKSLEKKYEIIGISKQKRKITSITQIVKDINKITITDLPKKIHSIIHMAALSNVEMCEKNSIQCYKVNFLGTLNMLEIARCLKSKFIFISSSHVYGIPKHLPIKENHPRIPTSVYSASKISGENLCEVFAKSYGMNISIARLFSVYGPGSPRFLVVSRIINQLKKSNKVTLGNLSPKRDFIFVEDVVNGIFTILRKSNGFNVYNIGNGRSYSILQVCSYLKKYAKKDAQIQSNKSRLRKNDVNNIVANNSKLIKLGWKPLVTLNEGLKYTYLHTE